MIRKIFLLFFGLGLGLLVGAFVVKKMDEASQAYAPSNLARNPGRAAGGLMGRLREASTAMAGGDLSARAPEDGPRELSEVARSFNEMADRLEELFDARRHLVAWASHDLRTPVASLRSCGAPTWAWDGGSHRNLNG